MHPLHYCWAKPQHKGKLGSREKLCIYRSLFSVFEALRSGMAAVFVAYICWFIWEYTHSTLALLFFIL